MKLNTRVRYGLRLLVELAKANDIVKLKDVASKEGISLLYLRQVVVPLEATGLVRSVRGAGGGYVLTRSPCEISLFDIVTALDGPQVLVDCLTDESVCDRVPSCAARRIWSKLQDSLHSFLKSVTLAEIVKEENKEAK